MKIVFEHSGVLPVLKYGGTERIIYWLMQELVRMGHEVVLIGHPDSEVKSIGATLIKRSEEDWRLHIPSDADILHLFNSPPPGTEHPLMVTIEGNGRPGEVFHQNTVFVSRKHAELHGSEAFVYNGLALEEYPMVRTRKGRWENFLFLAKAKWSVKNLADCKRACKKTKKHLHVAGGSCWWDLSTYTHYYGMVAQEEKLPLMEHMDALLWPVRWHEPFGIAIIEAFSQGMPVIASPYGSLKELARPETGILCSNYAEFEVALGRRKNNFNPEQIRHICESEFSAHVMAETYLKLYQKVVSGESLNPKAPATVSAEDPETLLPF